MVLVKELGPIFNKRCKYALFTPFSYTCKSDKMGEGRKLKFRSKSCLIKEKSKGRYEFKSDSCRR